MQSQIRAEVLTKNYQNPYFILGLIIPQSYSFSKAALACLIRNEPE